MRRYLPYALVAVIISGSFVLTSNQGSGPEAATRMITRVTDGGEATINTNGSNIRVNGVNVVASADGSAILTAHIVNRADQVDQLIGISVNGIKATLSGENFLKTNKPIHFEGDQANAQAVFPGVNLKTGTFVTVSFGFARAGIVTVNAIVQEPTGIYEGIGTGAKLAQPATE